MRSTWFDARDASGTEDVERTARGAVFAMRVVYPGSIDVTGRPDILELNAAALLARMSRQAEPS
jgi:hypothetical protein